MHLLALTAIPLFGLTGIVLLLCILSPVPIVRPGIVALTTIAIRSLRQGALGLAGLMPEMGRRSEARIVALEHRNIELERQIAELRDCVIQSLTISMETQLRLEFTDRVVELPRAA